MAEILKTQEQFSVQAGIQGLNGIACGDAVNGFDAAGRAPSVIPAKAGIQALHGIAYGDA